MKKIILFVAVISAFTFASCKKDRVCTCTTTTAAGSDTEIVTYNKAKKSDARENCMSYTKTGVVKSCTLK